MTWGEFKKLVEAQGLKDFDQLAFIDWERGKDPEIYREPQDHWVDIT